MVTRRTFLKGVAASGLIASSSALPVAALAKYIKSPKPAE